jgi:hypothetical protein
MLSSTLAGATLAAPYRGRSEMMRTAKQYCESARQLRQDGQLAEADLHRELYIVHRSLAQGKRLLSVNKAMEIAGVKPTGHPVLAIANASARWVWFIRDGGRINDRHGGWNHPAVAFVSDWSDNPGWPTKNAERYAHDNRVFRFVATHFAIRPSEAHIGARVPIVPPNLLPDKSLMNYSILWEADWKRSPKDPFLLKRITREWYEICAEWNLTSIERMVLEMAAFSGE